MDVYKEMCNKYGKVKIWSVSADELCYMVEELIKEKGD
jgi:hypothetical protein